MPLNDSVVKCAVFQLGAEDMSDRLCEDDPAARIFTLVPGVFRRDLHVIDATRANMGHARPYFPQADAVQTMVAARYDPLLSRSRNRKLCCGVRKMDLCGARSRGSTLDYGLRREQSSATAVHKNDGTTGTDSSR